MEQNRVVSFKPVYILGVFLLSFIFLCSAVNAATLNVDNSGVCDDATGLPYCHIQSAIDASSSGDTINVASGNYAESLTVGKGIIISGSGSTTIIDPAIDQNGFTITSDDVTIQNLKITLETSGVDAQAIKITGSNDVLLSGNTIETTGNKGVGIWIGGTGYSNSNNLKINGNTITINSESTGIYAEGGSTAQSGWEIESNTITANLGNPLELYDVSGSEVSYNTLTTTSSGGSNVMWFSELSNLANLVFRNNTISGTSASEVVIGNDLRGAPLDPNNVVITSITGVTISGNTFSNWGSRALRLGYVNGNGATTGIIISSNTFQMTTDSTNVIGGPATDKTGTGNIFNVNSPAKIQKAVDSALAGDTINVAAGTYNENVVVSKGLTLRAATGATISPTIGSGIQITASPADMPVTIDGFIITPQDNTLDSAQGIVIGDVSSLAATHDITLSNNNIITQGQNMGILVRGVGTNGAGYPNSQNLKVINNSITLNGDSTAFYASWVMPAHTNWVITGNTFDSPIGVNLELYDVDGATISGNVFEAAGSGGSGSVFISAELNSLSSPITFSNNDVQGNGAGSMVAFITNLKTAGTNTMEGVTITGNTFNHWAVAGRALGIYPRVSAVEVHQNNFVFVNGGTALRNTAASQVNATNNYWGCAGGPGTSGCNAVSLNIVYDTWWMNSAMTLPSTFITIFNGVHDTLNASDVDTNIDACGTHPDSCSGLYFEKYINSSPVGKLSFAGSLDLTSSETKNFLQAIGSKLEQGNGHIKFDATTSAIFKNPALGAALYMYDMPPVALTNLIVRDDSGTVLNKTGIVSGFSYDNATQTVSFTAAHFTQFDIDTTPPTIDAHNDVTKEATSSSGASVTYTSPVTHDNIDSDGIASCSLSSGSTFSVGNTTVTCTATDAAGNSATSTFTVKVVDTTPPTISPHEDVSVSTSSINGTAVTYTSPTKTDIVDGNGTASCTPSSASTFALGNTTVTCTATDAANNAATSVTFVVHVSLEAADGENLDLSSSLNNTGTKTEVTVPVDSQLSSNITVGNETKTIDVTIPAGITIMGNADWTGIVNAPAIETSTTVQTSTADFTSSVSKIVEIGFSGSKLTFDKAVKIVIPGETGKKIGYTYDEITFHEITDICADNTQATNDLLPDGGDCYWDDGTDMTIWTKHFTQFVTYTETAKPPASFRAGGSSRGGTTATTSASATTCTTNWQCADWSTCTDGKQTRICNDLNNCGIYDDMPSLAQGCTSESAATGETEPPATGFAAITGAVIGAVSSPAGIGIIIFVVLIVVGFIVSVKGNKTAKGKKEEKD